MAALAFKPYTYKPTAPRSKSTATHRRPAPEQVSILNKLQHTTLNGALLSTLRPAADDGGYRPGIRGTKTVFGGSNNASSDETDNDDRDLPTIEELLFTSLQAQGFTSGDRSPDRTSGVEEVAADEKGCSVDQSRSAPSDNSGRGPDDPIVLEDGNLSASEDEASDVNYRAESAAAPGAVLSDKPEIAIDPTTPSPLRSSDGWHDIDYFLEPSLCSRLAEQGTPTPVVLLPHTTSSRLSSEPLYDSISPEGSRRARSEATISSSSPPPHHARGSPETQLSQEGRLHTSRGVADEQKLIDHALDTLVIDEGARNQQEMEQEQEQEQEQERDEGNTENEDEGSQQEMNVVAPVVTAERARGSPRLANRQHSLPNLDSFLEQSYDEAGSRSGGESDDELNIIDSIEDDEKRLRSAKRKQLSLSHDGPTRKKYRRPLQKSSSCQRRHLSRPYRQYLESHSPLDQCSAVDLSSSAKGRLLSLTPSTPQGIDTKMSLGDSSLSPSPRASQLTLTKITFRPHSTHCHSFTATIRDGCNGRGVSLAQLARLIASTGHVGKIDDFTIKPIEQHSYLLSGFSRHTSSSTTAEGDREHVDVTRTRPQDGKAVDAGALIPRGSKPSSSDVNESGLSDSDPDPGSDCDSDGYSSEDELSRSGLRMNVRWNPVDEQRLLAYKKEGKSWKWIFRQFPSRTQPAIRTRLNIVQARGE